MARKQESEELIKSWSDDAKPVDLGESIGRLTRMDAIQQQHLAKAKVEQHKLRLKKIDAALKRIDDGFFGICPECDEAIDEKRLKAAPEALLCVECSRRQ